MKPRLVLGIGSPFGADRLGWDIVDQLKRLPEIQALQDELDIQAVDRPGPALIALMEGRGQVVLVDAVLSGEAPGTLHHLEADALTGFDGKLSTHDMGVQEALALGRALGALPPRIELFGLEVDAGVPVEPRARDALARYIARHLIGS